MTTLVRSLLVLGGGSEIAIATVERLIDEGLNSVVLAGRAGGSVDAAAADLLRDHPDIAIDVAGFDAADTANHQAALQALDATNGPFDAVLVAFGELGRPFTLDHDPAAAADLVQVNFAGAVSSCLASIAVLQGQLDARLIVISSIAAVRPRVGNLIYGSAKAGLDAFLVELAAPASARGVEIVIVRPGFVETRMTHGLEPAPLATTAAAVADDIVAGLEAGRRVIHSPAALAPVGRVLKHLPGPVWRRISAR